MNDWVHDRGLGDRFAMGIGICSGFVMSGNVGSDRRLEYATVGDTTNTAARLQSMTKETPHAVLIADSTRAALTRQAPDLTPSGRSTCAAAASPPPCGPSHRRERAVTAARHDGYARGPPDPDAQKDPACDDFASCPSSPCSRSPAACCWRPAAATTTTPRRLDGRDHRVRLHEGRPADQDGRHADRRDRLARLPAVRDRRRPDQREGLRERVAYAIADQLGFAQAEVKWTACRSTRPSRRARRSTTSTSTRSRSTRSGSRALTSLAVLHDPPGRARGR